MRTREELENARRHSYRTNGMEIHSNGSSNPHLEIHQEGESYEQQILDVLLDIRDLLTK